jgi:hypothetical protein
VSHREDGQALLLLVGALAAVLVGAFVLGAVARGVGAEGRNQRAADLGALAGARAMRASYDRLFEPPTIASRPNPATSNVALTWTSGATPPRAAPEPTAPGRSRSPSRMRAPSRRCGSP